MEERLRKSLWNSMLQADQEQRYWHLKACEYVARDFWGKVVLAILSSGAVAGWTFWVEVPALWKLLSALATLLSIIMPIAALSHKIVSMTELHGQWLQLKHGYESTWRDQAQLSEKDVRTRLDAAKKREAELSAKAISLPGQDVKLGEKTYHQVLKEWKDYA